MNNFIEIETVDNFKIFLNIRYIVAIKTSTFSGGVHKGLKATLVDYKRSVQATRIYTFEPYPSVTGKIENAHRN